MAVPVIEAWAPREIVTARKLNAQIRDPLRYRSDPPRLSCRGAVPGQSVTRGQQLFIRWATTGQGGTWFTVPDTGVYVVHGSVTVKAGSVQSPGGDGVILNIYRRSASGQLTSLAMAREIAQQPGDYEIVSTVTLVHLTAGDAIAAAVYLESGTPNSSYAIQAGEWETVLGAWMAAPGAAALSGEATPFVPAGDWSNQERITSQHMDTRITQPMRSLLNPPRVVLRTPLPYSAASGQATRVRWNASGMEQSGGWSLARDGSTVTVPADGVYLVALCMAVERDGPEGPFGSYQMNLARNGAVVAVHQRQNTRSGYPASITATDTLFLRRGETLGVEFLGTGSGLNWRGFGADISDERWNLVAAVNLASGSSGMGG
ncbi:hypothetical protein GCM10009544_18280 [Streptomyces stramineus]|uniref:C1q domain-containing protein n=1 Tax=Streptomyces stramineus TaxID=173861 RepID=A0ABN0ZR27_9ACTN